MRIKVNPSGQGQTSTRKTTVKLNPSGQGQTSTRKTTVKLNLPLPKVGKTRRRILILGSLAGSSILVALTKYFWDMGTSQKYTSQENSPIFSQETPLEDISTPYQKTPRENSSIPEAIPSPTPSPQPRSPIQIFTTVKVNGRGEIISRTQGQANVMTENLDNGVSLEMVKIPGGRFLMGSPDKEVMGFYNTEGPQHYVDVPEFFMGKYVVTQGQWKAIASRTDLKVQLDLKTEPSYFKGPDKDIDRWNRPVEQVNWYKAVEFCQRLSKLTGRNYRLPSEAEWEYACRAGTTTPFYFGETITTELVNYRGNKTYGNAPKGEYRKQTIPVGQFPANAFGLYDMHGNVFEWCADEWHDNYVGAPTDGSVWLNGNKSQSPLRGGSWRCNPYNCRSAFRLIFLWRAVYFINAGFRVVWDGGSSHFLWF
jgi:formylglycine-generating enzyme required for sulfatase activity